MVKNFVKLNKNLFLEKKDYKMASSLEVMVKNLVNLNKNLFLEKKKTIKITIIFKGMVKNLVNLYVNLFLEKKQVKIKLK